MGYAFVEAGLGVAVMDPVGQPLSNLEKVVTRPFRPAIPINPKLLFPAHRPLLAVERNFIDHLSAAAKAWQAVTEHVWKA